jgi:hypothetical protein
MPHGLFASASDRLISCVKRSRTRRYSPWTTERARAPPAPQSRWPCAATGSTNHPVPWLPTTFAPNDSRTVSTCAFCSPLTLRTKPEVRRRVGQALAGQWPMPTALRPRGDCGVAGPASCSRTSRTTPNADPQLIPTRAVSGRPSPSPGNLAGSRQGEAGLAVPGLRRNPLSHGASSDLRTGAGYTWSSTFVRGR